MNRTVSKYLRENDIAFSNIEIFPESWSRRNGFYGYSHTPRPLFALFFVCTDIEATFCPEYGENVSASRGDVIFIPRGAIYSVMIDCKTKEKVDTYTVNFGINNVENAKGNLPTSPVRVANLPVEMFERYCKNLEAVLTRIEGERSDHIKIRTALYALLDATLVAEPELLAEYYPIRAGIEAIKREWSANEKIEKYARMCGISAAYFYRCFRKWCGKSPVEYRNSIRLSNAEALLRATEMPINEISNIVGYDDPFYFCRIFTKKNGLSPQKYRRSVRELSKTQIYHF